MEKAMNAAALAKKTGFNFNKLWAATCMASSAAVSIGLIYLVISSLS